ncbi:MAG TPA: hypothetical protein VNI57_09440 [Candidatus Saccharimonadales bacterium]|nr:hypothetical protein [Candidatus Saccharimonadales bacterium]
MRSVRWFVNVLVVAVLVLAGSSPSWAIPAFARKYRTSCQTCHIAFPALTPFGEAFRLNGYRFPEGSDATMSKDQPVELGAEGYKKLWPRSVWPGELPGSVPLSLVVESEIANDRATKTTSFDGLGGVAAFLAAGTLGEHASFWSEAEFHREDGEITTEMERVNAQFRPFSSPILQIKVGSFEPGLTLVSGHRTLSNYGYLMTEEPVGDNQWAAEPFQQGIEFYGVAAHRILYNAGYVEGAGNAPNNTKDVYGRVAYKFGGLAFDGSTKGDASALTANPKPWSEKSITVSIFGYKGSPLLSETTTTLMNDPNTNIVSEVESTTSQNDPFTVYGGDVRWNFMDLIVRAGMSDRTDRRPFLSDPTMTDIKTQNRFGEIDWVAYPWLVPAARWEKFKVGEANMEKLSLTLQMLIRANVRGYLAFDKVKEPGDKYRTEEIVAGLAYGM